MEKSLKEKEFESIKNNVFYFDWNIFSYLKDPMNVQNDIIKINALCLYQILFNLLNREIFVTPYSNAHLLDILSGGEEFISEKLKFIDLISKGWEIFEARENRERIGIYYIEDIKSNFQEYKDSLGEIENFTDNLYQQLEPLFLLVKDYISFNTENVELNDEQKKDLDKLLGFIFPTNDESQKIELLKLIKKNKFNLKDTNNIRIRFPDYFKIKNENPEKETREIVDLCIKRSDLPFTSLSDLKSKIQIIQDTTSLSKFNNKILKLYFLAEFINVSTEKLKSKTAFQGIINDIFHLSYGLRANCLVTEDDALYKKAIFIKEFLGLNSNIYKMNEINEILLKEISLFVKEKHNLDKNEFKYVFNDLNGNFIKEYIIHI